VTLGYPSREAFLNLHPSQLSPPAQADGEDSFVKAERMMVTYRWLLDDGAPRYNNQHEFVGYVGHCLDITEQKVIEEQVREMAFPDPLTKLINRRLLMERLYQTMVARKRSGCHPALMFLDLDNFKRINDTYGHQVGDALLIEAASRLTTCVRAADAVARLGGAEFVVILGDLHESRPESISQAANIAEKIRICLSAPYTLCGNRTVDSDALADHRASASIGVVVFAGTEVSQEELQKWGDIAMYKAKEEGRNSIRFHAA